MTTPQDNKTPNYQSHDLADIFPMMEDFDLEALSRDIEKNGQHETIKIWQGKIIDGRNRYKACLLAGIDPKFEEITFKPTLSYVCGLNLHRRHLNETQRAWIAAKSAKVYICTQFDGAKAMNISLRLVAHASKIMDKAIPEICEDVAKGRIAAATASRISNLDADTQRNIWALNPKEMLKAVKQAEQTRSDPAPRIYELKFSVTEAEMRLIRNAMARKGTADTQEGIIRDAVLSYCESAYPMEILMESAKRFENKFKSSFRMKKSYSEKDHKIKKSGMSKHEEDEQRYWDEHGRAPPGY